MVGESARVKVAPSPEAIASARAIVEAFESAPGAGALQLDGKMIDAPHREQARQVLDRAKARAKDGA